MKHQNSYTLKLTTFTVEVTRKQMRSIRLRVLPNGSVRLSAPLTLSKKEIEHFVLQRQDWVENQLHRFAQLSALQNTASPDKDSLLLFGHTYPIRRITGPHFSLSIEDGEAILSRPDSAAPDQQDRFLDSWYRDVLKQTITERLSHWEEKTGLHCTAFQIRDMRSRWGSCTAQTGRIRFAAQLAKVPLCCLDYVILHELCHLAVANHGPEFKALLDRYMPDWRQRKNQLNGSERNPV